MVGRRFWTGLWLAVLFSACQGPSAGPGLEPPFGSGKGTANDQGSNTGGSSGFGGSSASGDPVVTMGTGGALNGNQDGPTVSSGTGGAIFATGGASATGGDSEGSSVVSQDAGVGDAGIVFGDAGAENNEIMRSKIQDAGAGGIGSSARGACPPWLVPGSPLFRFLGCNDMAPP